METGRTILPRPLVLNQPFHFPGQMAVDAIFRTHLRWCIQGFFNHLFLWVQSPALSGNGSLSASQVPRGRGRGGAVTEEEWGHPAEHRCGKDQDERTCSPALEEREMQFSLGSLYLGVKAQPCPPRTLISGEPHPWGLPILKDPGTVTERTASVLFGEKITEVQEF